ncbi:bromodomain adjacent to zinc finger domain protein 2B-like isoform X3 [Clavelina lepadiformis]|uniref:bromodomain adjacent to zinc finger domain protein 2B-like isoform X3 n=1 Tax=Clavelina lepadiformis TaxID=159417 RepID=UPI004042B763
MDQNKSGSRREKHVSDQNKTTNSNSQKQTSFAAQMGLSVPPVYLNPTLFAGSGFLSPSDMVSQQLLNLQGAGLPGFDPNSFHALNAMAGLSASGGMPLNIGSDLMSMAMAQQNMAALNSCVAPSMTNSYPNINPFLNQTFQQLSMHEPRNSLSSNKDQTSINGERDGSTLGSTASTSRLTPSKVLSPRHTSTSHNTKVNSHSSYSASDSVSKVIKNQAEALAHKQAQTEQLMQAEMMKHFEQQYILQQMQLQQQQDQLEAALKAVRRPVEPSGSHSQFTKNASQSDKLQQQLSESIYQQLLSSTTSGLVGMQPPPNTYFGSQALTDGFMGLGQLPPVPPTTSRRKTSYKSSELPSTSSQKIVSPKSNYQPNSKNGCQEESNTNMFLAAIYNQLQQERGPAAASLLGLPPTSLSPSDDTHSIPNLNNTSPGLREKLKEISTRDEPQRKSNESSQGQIKDTSQSKQSSSMSLRDETPGSENALSKQIALDGCHGEKLMSNKNMTMSQMESKSPSWHVKNNIDFQEAERSSTFDGNTDEHREKTTAANPFTSAGSNSHTKQHNQNDNDHAVRSFTEADFMQAISAQECAQSIPSGGNMETFMLACNHLLSSGQPGDLNKVNEMLAAVVALEMQRLQMQQMQQMNLTKELKMLRKTDSKSTSEEASKQCVGKPPLSKVSKHSYQADFESKDSLRDEFIGPGDKPIRKRRRVISNEEEVLLPLKEGWKREVRFKYFGNQLRGEVFYVSPDGKKHRTFPDVLKFLEDNNVTHLHRNNFSFSSRLRIGSFYEQKDKNTKQWTKISENELDSRWGSMEQLDHSPLSKSVSSLSDSVSRNKSRSKVFGQGANLQNQADLAKRALQERMRHEDEQQALKEAAEAKFRLRQQQKAQAKLEKQQRMEQQKMEREMRERQLIEERQKLEAARQLMKYQDALRKAKEKNTQRQIEAMEREQRRQNLVLLKALETKRRAEERDKRREELRNEKIFIRERKLEQRRLAMKLARELKMPVEDMCLTDNKHMPDLKPLQGIMLEEDKKAFWTQLSGNATATVLMVLEFLYTFKDAILIDESVIPSFEQLQRGLLNDPEHIGSLVRLTMALLHQCLCDPGVPAPGPWLHCAIGLKVTDVDVSKGNYSEILRLFVWARNGNKNDITQLLETEPFPSLTPDQKADILGFLVNELICSQPVCTEIDKHLDNLATLRRDKWIVEGKIRQVRIEHAHDESDHSTSSPSKIRSKNKGEDEMEEKGEKDDSSKDNDSITGDSKPTCRSDTVIQRKIKKLTKEHQSFNERLFSSSKPLRAIDMGQDRYKRRYWVLSNLGGVFVEGLESGHWYDDDEFETDENEIDEKKHYTFDGKIKIKQENVPLCTTIPENVKPPQTDTVLPACGDTKGLSDMTDTKQSDVLLPSDENAAVARDINIKTVESGSVTTKENASEISKHFKNLQTKVSDADHKMHGKEMTETTAVENKTSIKQTAGKYPPIDAVSRSKASSAKAGSLSQHCVEEQSSKKLFDDDAPEILPVDANPISTSSDGTNLVTQPCNKSVIWEAGTSNITSAAVTNNINEPLSSNHITARINNDVTNFAPHSSQSSNNINSTVCSEPPPVIGSVKNCVSQDIDKTTKVTSNHSATTSNNSHCKNNEATDLVLPCSNGNNPIDFNKLNTMISLASKTGACKKPEDSVEAAARAIAAKAVASSSHLLFPQFKPHSMRDLKNTTTTDVKGTLNEPTTQNLTPEKNPASHHSGKEEDFVDDTEKSSLGKHMTMALESIGMDAHELSCQQLEVLTGKNMKDSLNDLPGSSTRSQDHSHCSRNPDASEGNVTMQASSIQSIVKNSKLKLNPSQDIPMDLSNYLTDGLATSTSLSHDEGNMKNQPSPSGIKTLEFVNQRDFNLSESQMFSHVIDNLKMEPGLVAMKTDYDCIPSKHILAQNVREQPLLIPKQMKYGWWKITTEEDLNKLSDCLHSRGLREKNLHKGITKYHKYCVEAMETASKSEFQFENGPNFSTNIQEEQEQQDSCVNEQVAGDKSGKIQKRICSLRGDTCRSEDVEDVLENPVETAFQIEMEALKQVEDVTDQCVNVGILNKAWENLPKASVCQNDLAHIPYSFDDDNTLKHDWSNPICHNPKSVLNFAVDLLIKLEQALPRNYLKPPLIRKGGSSEFSNLPSLSEAGASDVAAGLRTWRNAVSTATSAAQLSMCVAMLESCIAWERTPKNPFKVDSSPKPKRKRVDKRPAPKSQAAACSSKKRKGQKVNELLSHVDDDELSNSSQKPLDCSEPTASTKEKTTEKKSFSSSEQDVFLHHTDLAANEDGIHSDDNTSMHSDDLGDEDATATSSDKGMGNHHTNNGISLQNLENDEKAKKKRKKTKDKIKKKKSHPFVYREILKDLQTHELATWFLFPVDPKVAPDYRKIIKKPMDFDTIENRLKKGRYKLPEQFSADVRLVFDNCQIYNEDNSPIGSAGQELRKYFDKRWAELEMAIEVEEKCAN